MTRISSFTLALFALIIVSLIAVFTTDAAPAPVKPPKTKAPPTFTVFSLSKLKGKSKVVSGLGCHNHNLGTIGSVKYGSGPLAGTKFFQGKNCSGKVNHQMDTSTVKSMGGPYKSNSVLVF
ncbi:hypothetical protein BGZ76_000230 [Entomortierella beljakovae]|nr:hypothetical protein BGZ76_000230 [Entomortierella beljakovae]